MSGVSIYTWYPINPQFFCNAQTAAAGVPLVLNSGGLEMRFTGSVSRTVRITTNFNMVGNVIVNGTLFGKPISETVVAPNNTTVETVGFFDSVTSIVPSVVVAGANRISAGSGQMGNTNWFAVDEYRPFPSLAVEVVVSSNVINYTFLSTLQNPATSINQNAAFRRGIICPQVDNVNAFTKYMVAETVSKSACLTTPTLYACIAINSSDATGSLIASFLQQGIR